MVGPGYGNYAVTIIPDPPFSPPVITYSANKPYYGMPQALSWSILNPSVNYTLEFKAFGGGHITVTDVVYYLSKWVLWRAS